MNSSVKVDAKSVRKNKLIFKLLYLILILLLLIFTISYSILYIINTNGNFTISLDENAMEDEKLIVSPRKDFSYTTHKIVVDNLDYMDNISGTWLPEDIDSVDGPHNGNNYMAYTFYVKNNSNDTISYSVSINILSVIKDVDDAVRVVVYRNGEKSIYAKRTPIGDVEPGTIPFVSKDIVSNNLYENFKPDDVDKFTVVVYLEGDDPQCINDIIGGEMKMNMLIGENTLKYER